MPSQYIISGESTGFEQGKTMTQFRAGKFSNLISVDMINEGVDLPDVSMVILLESLNLVEYLFNN